MKNILLFGAIAVLITACGKSFDADKVRVGMPKAELLSTCGEPDQVINWFGIELYKYGKAAVSVQGDTISAIALDFTAKMQEASAGLDSLKSALEQIGQASPRPTYPHVDLSFVAIGMDGDTLLAHMGEPDGGFRKFGNGVWWLSYGDQIVETRDFVVARIMDRAAAEDSIGVR